LLQLVNLDEKETVSFDKSLDERVKPEIKDIKYTVNKIVLPSFISPSQSQTSLGGRIEEEIHNINSKSIKNETKPKMYYNFLKN